MCKLIFEVIQIGRKECFVHWFTNESLMGVTFAANKCTQSQYLLQRTVGCFHTLKLNKRQAATNASPGPSHLIQSDSSP